MQNTNTLLTVTEAAELLHCSISTLARWRSEREIDLDYIKLGGKVLYKKNDVLNFIETNTVSKLEG